MRALLVRVGADQSESGGRFNGPVDTTSNEFAYVPIREGMPNRPGCETPYLWVNPAVERFSVPLPTNLRQARMHLDPDFSHLTYGDQGKRGHRISDLDHGHVLAFYSGLRDVNPEQIRLVYAITGFYVIEEIVRATLVPRNRWHENAHTRCVLRPQADDVVVRARDGKSGRLMRCLPIGSYRRSCHNPNGRECYRVDSRLLEAWGGLTVSDGWLERSAYLPEFRDPARFLRWFWEHAGNLVRSNW
jgi:hypothetical protein